MEERERGVGRGSNEERNCASPRSFRNRIRSRRGSEGCLEVFDCSMTLCCKINRSERDLIASFVGDVRIAGTTTVGPKLRLLRPRSLIINLLLRS